MFTANFCDIYMQQFSCLSPTGQRRLILKDSSISCEHAELTSAVPLPGYVQCELILIPATFFINKAMKCFGSHAISLNASCDILKIS